jgi:hypothetical protein
VNLVWFGEQRHAIIGCQRGLAVRHERLDCALARLRSHTDFRNELPYVDVFTSVIYSGYTAPQRFLSTRAGPMNNAPDKPGFYEGFHHREYTEALKALLLAGSFARARELLEPLLNAIEAEDRVDPWHYTQLATIYMREGNEPAAQVIIERYARHNRIGIPLVLSRPSQ